MGEAISLHAATSLLRCHCITNPNNTKIFRTNHSTLPQTCSVWSSQSFPQTQNQKVLGTLATTSRHSAKLQVLPRFSRSLAKKNGRAHSPLGPADSNRINKLQTCRVKKPILGKMSWSWNEVATVQHQRFSNFLISYLSSLHQTLSWGSHWAHDPTAQGGHQHQHLKD